MQNAVMCTLSLYDIIGITRHLHIKLKSFSNIAKPLHKEAVRGCSFLETMFLKTSVSNGIIYTKYTQNPHIIEPPFNIATQSATYTVTACVSRWEPNVLNANNPCPAARQKQYWYFISLLRFSALKCKPNGQKNVVVLENLIIESLHMIETEL